MGKGGVYFFTEMTLSSVFAKYKLGTAVAKYGIAVVAGALIASAFYCGKTQREFLYKQDTVIFSRIDTILKTPIVIQQVTTRIVDSVHDCWNFLPLTINEHGDSLSIDSINSCKGIVKGIHLNYKPEFLFFADTIFHRDSVVKQIPFTIPSIFTYDVSLKAGSGIGCSFLIGAEGNIRFGRGGIFVEPSVLFQDKIRAFCIGGIFYKLF